VAVLFAAVEMMNQFKRFIDSTRLEIKNIDRNLFKKPIDQNLIRAAVLIPFAVWEHELVILFTKRTNSVNNHQNQISFPGGAIDKNDANPLAAALRETGEEIGIKKKDIEILGELESRSTTTGFYIYPFVGFIHNLDEIRFLDSSINKLEVERIIYIPLNWLCNPKNSYTEAYKGQDVKGYPFVAFSNYDGEKVWGVTASLLKQLLEIIKK
jgi:8-oxo-dGTP pyrophosphatase MutT (NUDIX family)